MQDETILFFQKNYLLVALSIFITFLLFSLDDFLRSEEDKMKKSDFIKILIIVGTMVFGTVYIHKIEPVMTEQILTRPPNM